VTTLYRMGELCEGPIGDQEGARTHFEGILDTAPGYLPALEGLERVYTRLQAWDNLAAVYEQRALLCEDPSGIALQLHRAGAVCEFRLGEHARARDFYCRALEQVADFPPSLDAFARILEGEGDWAQLARVLSAAAKVTRDSNEVVSLTYRAARILADLVDDPARAVASLDRCLELQPGFLPAITLLRELSARTGAWQEVYTLHRLEAESAEDLYRRHWRMIAAADVAERVPELDEDAVLSDILAEDSRHAGALGALERRALASGNNANLLAVYQQLLGLVDDEADRVRIASRIAGLARDQGDTVSAMQAVSEVIGAEDDSRPVLAIARIAESLNYWEEARRALESAEGSALERARLLEAYGGEPAQCAEAWQSILVESPTSTEAASGLERALTRMGSREGLADAHGVLADNLPDAPLAAFHSLLAGHLFEAGEDLDRAIHHYEVAFKARPYPGKAFDALRRIYAGQRNIEALTALFDALQDPSPVARAEALEEAGDSATAAEIYATQLAASAPDDLPARLPLMLRLEHCLELSEQWIELFSLLTTRKETTAHPDARLAIESKRRWLLTEKLSETDEAWDFYRQLHEESPQDVEVLEALARIAGARGETGLAIQYLEGLSQTATSAVDAARYQRRIAEVHLRTDNQAAARRALEQALDLNSSDTESLEQLKSLAIAGEDWRGLVGVLSREAASAPGKAQVDCYRQIADIWESRLNEPMIAQETWGRVFELSPGDPEALQHLVDLARSREDWMSFAEKGALLVQILEGPERSEFMAELGGVLLHRLHRESDALRYLDAASSSDHPSLAAARELERIYMARGAWEQVVEIMVRQAQATEDPADATAILLRAAEARLDTLHDRDGAAEIYGMILEIQPGNPEALRFRGDYLYKGGDLEGAVDIFRELEAVDEELDLDDFDVRIEAAQYYFRFADSLRRIGEIDEALQRYEKALEFNSSHLPTLEAIGPIYITQERWTEAANTFRQILQLTGGQGDPERIARTYTNLGIIEHNLGKHDKAKKRFNKALELRPNDIAALQGIAAVLFARSDWNNLLNVYNNIIYHAQEPGEVVEAYLTKGYVLDAKLGLPAKAAQHYEKSLDFDPAQPAAYLRLAELALRKQDWPEAAGLADRGLSLEIEEARLLSGLHLVKAIAHQACGDTAAAQDGYRAAVDADSAIASALGVSVTTAEEMHTWLQGRLQERP
jgi:tetratricopeptide (TPR) repeat protein